MRQRQSHPHTHDEHRGKQGACMIHESATIASLARPTYERYGEMEATMLQHRLGAH